MNLMFTKGHTVTGNLELVQSFCYEVARRKANVHDGRLCKEDDFEEVLYGECGLFEHLLFLLSAFYRSARAKRKGV